MADPWRSVGAQIAPDEGEWLYRQQAGVRGPVPFKVIVDRLLKGELDPETPVAREGGSFHPISRVAAFGEHVKEAVRLRAERQHGKRRRTLIVILLIVIGAGSAGGYVGWQAYQRNERKAALDAKHAREELERKRLEAQKLPKMGLVALVSLGTAKDVMIRSGAKKPGHKPGAREEEASDELAVASCKLDQAAIFGTLQKSLGKLNVCVEDEKAHDTQGLLPPQLELEFVVQPSGKVSDFQINDRHYRKGSLNNCMVKAFNTIAFPASTGSACPVTIPIKIGK